MSDSTGNVRGPPPNMDRPRAAGYKGGMPTAVELAARYRAVRAVTERLRAPLSAEDCQAQ